MVRKSLTSGLIIGLLLVLTLAFLVINDQVSRVLPDWQAMDFAWLPRDVLQTFFLTASSLLLLFVGTLAAMRTRPATLQEGFKAGAISGLIAAIVVHGCLGSLAIIRGGRTVVPLLLRPDPISEELLLGRAGEAAAITIRLTLSSAFLLPLAGLIVGGVEGFVYTLLRRAGGRPLPERPKPSLLDRARQDKPLRWPDEEEHTLRAGLLGGLIVGGFLSLEVLLLFVVALTEGLPEEFRALVSRRLQFSVEAAEWLSGITFLLLFLTPIAILLWGGSGVLLLKRPPSRFRSRFLASIICGATAGTIFSLLIGLTIFNTAFVSGTLIATKMEGTVPTVEEIQLVIRRLIPLYPFVSISQVLAWTLLGFFFGLPFVIITPFTWPRRPVDRAATLFNRIRRQSSTLLPQLYNLFQRDRHAEDVLLHLTKQLHHKESRPAALVTAAYHTLYSSPQHTAEALRAIVDVLDSADDWRWRREIGELHRFLEEGLRAQNLHHLAAIQPLPEEQTSTLPSILTQIGVRLSRIVGEIKKGHRLDDPNSRTIYLNRALEEVTAAEKFALEIAAGKGRHAHKGARRATPYPEQKVLEVLLPQWRETLHEIIRDLRGRAVLKAELLTRQMAYMPQLRLRLQVSNEGLNVAERVRITLEPRPDYLMTAESEARIELLPPGEEQVVELALSPRNPRRARVVLHLLYNDAVDENRALTVADEIVFVEADRPFQRIFPIPYITGTPLKTPEMFFGRQDVFDYVREHLLGTYQNNIIVLHGQRRTGKTSVLYQLSRVLAETHRGVLLDMQGVAARSETEFFYALSDEIAYALESHDIEAQIPPIEAYEAQPEFTFRTRFLRPLYPHLGDKHLLLMFDEFEELQRHVEEGHLTVGIFSFLRNLMQHEVKVDFVFSGTHKLEELAAEYWSILFNIATYKKISFLERKEIERLVTEPVAPYGMEYDPLAVDHIYQVTAGHPFLAQMVCHEMVAYHNDIERSYLTVADVDAVLEQIAERGEAHFKFVWSESSGAGRAAMLALAELLGHADGATVREIADLSRRRGRHLTEEGALSALVRLESRDIVTRTALGSDRFRFRVDLVRRWIVRNPQLADTITL